MGDVEGFGESKFYQNLRTPNFFPCSHLKNIQIDYTIFTMLGSGQSVFRSRFKFIDAFAKKTSGKKYSVPIISLLQ